MTVYGNINADMDVWFESIFYAKNSKSFFCHDSLFNITTNQGHNIAKRKKIVVDAIRDENGDYSVEIFLVYPKKTKCDYTIEAVKLKVSKKGYKKVIPSGKGGIENDDSEDYNLVYPINLPNKVQEGYILGRENIFECQYRDYHSIGQDSIIRCNQLKAIKDIVTLEKNIQIKINIILNDTDIDGNRYAPEKNMKRIGFFSNFINKIFGK